MTFVAEHVQNVPFSGIRRFFDIAGKLDGVISLGVGEPDFVTPWNVREEAIFHLERRRTVYTANAGTIELRNQIAFYIKGLIGVEYSPETQILVTVGASEAIDIALRAVINPGDHVLIAEPCFVSYAPCVVFAGGIPIPIETKKEDSFKLKPEVLKAAITPKTKAIIISYPNNPTGATMTESDLEKIAEVLKEQNILVISDEIYAELTYDSLKHCSIAAFPDMKEKTIVINGFSKSFAMTGWRLGYACGPKDVISAMLKIHQYAIMCAPTTAQFAAVEALANSSDSVRKMRIEFEFRRNYVVKAFRSLGMDVFSPGGAFYLFPSFKNIPSVSGLTSEQFCEKLLCEGGVAVVPGSAFGASGEGCFRCSYAYSLESLKAAVSRIGSFLEKL